MAMTRKHFEAMAVEGGVILSEIKSKDLMLQLVTRADIAEVIVRVADKASQADVESGFDREKFERVMWAVCACHDK